MHELDEYQSQALQSAVYPLERALDYTMLGLLSEIGELAEVYYEANSLHGAGFGWSAEYQNEAISETGDCYWYTAAIADALGTTLGQLVENSFGSTELVPSRGLTLVALLREAGLMAGILKKSIRDGGGVLEVNKSADLKSGLLNVLALLDHFATLLGSSRKAALNKNLNKLAGRKARGTLQGSGNSR